MAEEKKHEGKGEGKSHEGKPYEGKSHFGQSHAGAKEAEEAQKSREAREAHRETGQPPLPASNPPAHKETHEVSDPRSGLLVGKVTSGTTTSEPSRLAAEPQPPPIAEPPPTGKGLLDALRSDFVPSKVLEESSRWLKEHPDATAVELYLHMEAHQGHPDSVTLGTLRKAGKFAYGDTFEPEQSILQGPGEELARLRAENAQLLRTIEQRDAKQAALVRQLDAVSQDKNEAVSRLRAMEALRSRGAGEEDKPGISR